MEAAFNEATASIRGCQPGLGSGRSQSEKRRLKHLEAAAEEAGDEDYEAPEVELPEEEAAANAAIKFDKAKAAYERFAKRPKVKDLPRRPDLTVLRKPNLN